VEAGGAIALDAIGLSRRPSPPDGIPAAVWELAQQANDRGGAVETPQPTDVVQVLVAERTAARTRGDWVAADRLRDRVAAEGWEVRDTPDGPELIAL
jgi:cysteinyl-tRNA synthetase